MTINIVEREQIHIVGMQIETLLKDTREKMIIPKLQQSFNERLKEIDGVIGLPVTYGIFIDPPNYNFETDPFVWIAGVEANPNTKPPLGMISYHLPKATYAVIEYQGDIHHAGNAYDKLYTWIRDSEYELADSYGFEMYSSIHSALEFGIADFSLHFPIRLKN